MPRTTARPRSLCTKENGTSCRGLLSGISIPMTRDFGMALAPWGVLAGGKLRTDAEEQKRLESGEQGRKVFSSEWMRNDVEVKVSRALEKVAAEVGATSITSVAIPYVMQKNDTRFPYHRRS
ncbi:arylalcohol dehydrogenase [Moniliophthora roreri MCA 2997]|uniref:Arylalcohol dehydrogenase n=1 Tax=Moniliophthora roreri (strain MCA 2997) TaxID=1381753 RepID=V2XIC4_MONRO|nr:arylalcohol dehydrogenase [Moniliophthora roreri MCA 2997]